MTTSLTEILEIGRGPRGVCSSPESIEYCCGSDLGDSLKWARRSGRSLYGGCSKISEGIVLSSVIALAGILRCLYKFMLSGVRLYSVGGHI